MMFFYNIHTKDIYGFEVNRCEKISKVFNHRNFESGSAFFQVGSVTLITNAQLD